MKTSPASTPAPFPIGGIALFLAGAVAITSAAPTADPYQPNWSSLARNKQCPEWFRDAKFGIYTHWGPVTVGAEDGPAGVQWYGRNMYVKSSPTFAYHRAKYGDQNQFGYKDLVPLFKAEKFNADAWADLFAAAGARFAGPVAIHHDNYAMWDSQLTPWDSMDQSPHRDFTGELARAIRQRGLKFITTFHHSFSWEYFEPAFNFDAADGKNTGLYTEPHQPGAPPSRAYLDKWLGMVHEVVTHYRPDLIWFDFGLGKLIPPAYQQRMFADYYNWAARNHVAVGVAHKHWDIHEHAGIIDFERGREDRLTPYPWLTDTSIGPWFNQKSVPFKSVNALVDVLVDIVSKNGCMLLNVGPAADGTIPSAGEKILRGMGQWLRVNGPAIYNTRPWLVYGEGPTRQEKSGGFSEHEDKPFSAADLRFTRSKDGGTVYVTTLAWPERPFTVQSMQIGKTAHARVQLLGYSGPVHYRVNAQQQLVIEPPPLAASDRPGAHAFAFALTGFELSLHPEARFNQPGAITLTPGQATREGEHICLQDKGGRPNLGCWDDPRERVHWLVWIKKAGRYQARGEFSSAYGRSRLQSRLAGQTSVAEVPPTRGWFQPVFVPLGQFTFDQPGVYQLRLAAAEANSWKAVNVWQVQLAPLD